MTQYILSILGIVLAGVIIDIIIPSGSINKYIRSLYAIFVVAVILTPLINFISQKKDVSLKYQDYQVNQKLITYIFNQRVKSIENNILNNLNSSGFNNIDIKINYSVENNELSINSCTVNLQNVVIDGTSQHINKYEFIIKVVKEFTDLSDEEIIFYE